jgi:hypothetical protein
MQKGRLGLGLLSSSDKTLFISVLVRHNHRTVPLVPLSSRALLDVALQPIVQQQKTWLPKGDL